MARNGAPAGRVEAFIASSRGVERVRPQAGTAMSKLDDLTESQIDVALLRGRRGLKAYNSFQ